MLWHFSSEHFLVSFYCWYLFVWITPYTWSGSGISVSRTLLTVVDLSLVNSCFPFWRSLSPFSCPFWLQLGLGYAAGRIIHQTSNMPAVSGKRFKPSKYVPVSAAAIFLVGATTLFFAFTWVNQISSFCWVHRASNRVWTGNCCVENIQ